jgi:hypothetical protein
LLETRDADLQEIRLWSHNTCIVDQGADGTELLFRCIEHAHNFCFITDIRSEDHAAPATGDNLLQHLFGRTSILAVIDTHLVATGRCHDCCRRTDALAGARDDYVRFAVVHMISLQILLLRTGRLAMRRTIRWSGSAE